jgi:hypothetical protein
MIMDSNVVKFPYDASRRVHSRKPRRSKNGTPEERAEREAASTQATRAAILAFAAPRLVPDPEPPLARAHRCNPLRSQFLPISPAVTIAGKMAKHPEHLLEICQGVRENVVAETSHRRGSRPRRRPGARRGGAGL